MPRGLLGGGQTAGPGGGDSLVADPMGRRARALSGPVTARAAGNSVVTSDLRGGASPAAAPGRRSGHNSQSQSFGGLVLSTPDQRGEARAAYGGGWADGRLTVRERFVQVMFGNSRQGAQESHSGVPNPQADGPPLPEYLQDNRSLSWQIGTDLTTQEDNPGPFAKITQTSQDAVKDWPGPISPYLNKGEGTAWPFGTQDGVPWSTRKFGGTAGLHRPYGHRGAGIEGPAPTEFALPGDGTGARIGTLVRPGDPGDGPQQFLGGPPHGRHSQSEQPRSWTMARQASIPQQKPGRNDRPNNSKIAGQSYNQTVVPEGRTGSGRMPRLAAQAQAGNVQGRFLRRS
jgi:hypothetical protein